MWKCGDECPSKNWKGIEGEEMLLSDDDNLFFIRNLCEPFAYKLDKQLLEEDGLAYIVTLEKPLMLETVITALCECVTMVTGIQDLSYAFAGLFVLEEKYRSEYVDSIQKAVEGLSIQFFISEKLSMVSAVGWNTEIAKHLDQKQKESIENVATCLHLIVAGLRDDATFQCSFDSEAEKIKEFEEFLATLK
jgi:hypothetical protein